MATSLRSSLLLATVPNKRKKAQSTGKEKPPKLLSPKTVNNTLSCLSSMLTAAVKWKYLSENPCAGVEFVPVPEQPFRYYTEEQSSQYLDATWNTEPELYVFVYTSLGTGMRLGELIALEVADIQFEREVINGKRSRTRGLTTAPKNGKSRDIDMTDGLQELLAAHLATLPPNQKLVFTAKDGKPLTRDTLKHAFERLWQTAGLHRTTPHDMRHSYASQLVMKGVPMRVIQQLLGHADITTTMRYAHVSPGVRKEWVSRLSDHTPPNAKNVLRIVDGDE